MRKLHAKRYATAVSGTMIAVVFALFALGLSTLESWIPQWELKPGQEAPVTVRLPARYFRITMLRNEFHYLSTASSTCPHLVPRGTKLKRGRECTGLALAYEKARRELEPQRLAGNFAFYFIVGLVLSAFMRQKRMGRARQLRAQNTVFVLLILLMAASKAILLFTSFSAVILPIATVPALVAYYCRRQVGLLTAITAAVLVSSLVNFDIELFIIFSIAGTVTVVTVQQRSRRAVQVKAGAMAAWVAVIATVVTTLIFSGTLDIYDDVAEHVDPRYSLWISAVIGGLSSGILAWLLTPFVGTLMGEISRSKLLDLQDLDQRLLRHLRENAPGTWEHSRAMANLAEAAAHAIGANALLARVGAYYHDVGKSLGPEFFIENQGGGPNPHDALLPDESTNAIFRHVVEGTKILRDEGIPEDVVEFSYSHHGTSVLEYFWHKNLSAGNPEGYKEVDFTYPGHNPTTRETGILMIVDAIEAAARTVDAPDRVAFNNLVQRIIFFKLCQGQLDETGLSLADLKTVANTLVDTLVNMYHSRIKYPWQTSDTTGHGTASSVTPTGPAEPSDEPVAAQQDTASAADEAALKVQEQSSNQEAQPAARPGPKPTAGEKPDRRTPGMGIPVVRPMPTPTQGVSVVKSIPVRGDKNPEAAEKNIIEIESSSEPGETTFTGPLSKVGTSVRGGKGSESLEPEAVKQRKVVK